MAKRFSLFSTVLDLHTRHQANWRSHFEGPSTYLSWNAITAAIASLGDITSEWFHYIWLSSSKTLLARDSGCVCLFLCLPNPTTPLHHEGQHRHFPLWSRLPCLEHWLINTDSYQSWFEILGIRMTNTTNLTLQNFQFNVVRKAHTNEDTGIDTKQHKCTCKYAVILHWQMPAIFSKKSA